MDDTPSEDLEFRHTPSEQTPQTLIVGGVDLPVLHR